jgi:predicted nucleic acid-binding Zn ribbon protein
MNDLRRVGEDVARLGRVPSVDPLVTDSRRVWDAAVGSDVARNSLPVRRSGGALVVLCASASWANELTLLEGRVRRKLEELLEHPPARLKFEVGDVDDPSRQPPPDAPAPPRAPTESDRRQASELARPIADPDLRTAAERAIAAALARDL